MLFRSNIFIFFIFFTFCATFSPFMVADNYFLSFLMVSKFIAIVWCGVYNKSVYTLYIMCCCVLFLCYGVMALHFRENKSIVFVF